MEIDENIFTEYLKTQELQSRNNNLLFHNQQNNSFNNINMPIVQENIDSNTDTNLNAYHDNNINSNDSQKDKN